MADRYDVNTERDAVDQDLNDGICYIQGGREGADCSLRAAIMQANANAGRDAIVLPMGHYQLRLNGSDEDLGALGDLDISDDLTIFGMGIEPFNTRIDSSFALRDRILHVITSNLTLNNLAIQGGNLARGSGGGIKVDQGATLTLERVHISGNQIGVQWADGGPANANPNVRGAGIMSEGNLHLIESLVWSNNNYEGEGGGIYSTADLFIETSEIIDNSSFACAGGICIPESALEREGLQRRIRESFIVGNTTIHAAFNAGGIFAGKGPLQIVDSSIHANYNNGNTGGLLIIGQGFNAELTRSSITNNVGIITGGILSRDVNTRIVSSTISGNHAVTATNGSAGGIFYQGGRMEILNSTVARNISAYREGVLPINSQPYAGGIHNGTNSGRNLVIQNSILFGNSLKNGDGPRHISEGFNEITSRGYNRFSSRVGFEILYENEDLDATDHIIPNLHICPLAKNGARNKTYTHALPKLPELSQALSQIPMIHCGEGGSLIDQRGKDRNVDGLNFCDVGAFEFSDGDLDRCFTAASECGDGIQDPAEECDDGDRDDDDGCDSDCRIEDNAYCIGSVRSQCGQDVCGNRIMLESRGEECDDGNVENGDGCDGNCKVELGYTCVQSLLNRASECSLNCGNGRLDASEICDDGNVNEGDGCDAACQIEESFQCEGEPSRCAEAPEPVVPNCGSGTIDAGEGCDDGNVAAGDGCSPACQIEPDYLCEGEPSVCQHVVGAQSICGNAAREAGEGCDDGNVTDGDGCSASCEVEANFNCDQASPTVCVATGQNPDPPSTPASGGCGLIKLGD